MRHKTYRRYKIFNVIFFFSLSLAFHPLVLSNPSTSHNRVAITTMQHSLYCHVDVYLRYSSCWEKKEKKRNNFVVVEFDVAFFLYFVFCVVVGVAGSALVRWKTRFGLFFMFSVHINLNKHRVQHARGYIRVAFERPNIHRIACSSATI